MSVFRPVTQYTQMQTLKKEKKKKEKPRWYMTGDQHFLFTNFSHQWSFLVAYAAYAV